MTTTLPPKNNPVLQGPWTAEESAGVYGLPDWGKGYFGIAPEGHLEVRPGAQEQQAIDLFEVVQGLAEREIHTPVLLRFPELTQHRLSTLHDAFARAIEENDYKGQYHCVYPIKVNQQRFVCEEMRDLGSPFGFGFEVGSKPELLAALGMMVGHDEMPIVCNGFKDREYIETVVLATKLGRNIIPVVERFADLKLIIAEAERYEVRPKIGLRVKPSARGAGRWQASTGIRSKFGLSPRQLLHALDVAKEHQMGDCLKMLHFHIGSQLSDIRRLKGAITELAHFYAELRRLGAGLEIIDIGGGLGVDYDGSQTSSESSMNYTIAEYANDVVYRIQSVCDDTKVPHPTIFSESGRAMVAYSTMLVFDVVGAATIEREVDVERARARLVAREEEDQPQPLHDLLEAYEGLTDRNMVEAFHDALQARDEAISLFSLGYIDLELRATAEALFWAICAEVLKRGQKRGQLPEELEDLTEAMADVYYCNFSIFQSMPDAWAIKQLFPIMPIHRLNEEPTRLGTLADITCDSDGKIDNFVHRKDLKKVLELHPLVPGEPYFLGVFLIGAYQEILGDLHNLFGDTNVVHVRAAEEGGWAIEEVVKGDTVKEVLGYVGYQADELVRALRQNIECAVRSGTLSLAEGRLLLRGYEQGMAGYTYLE
ncbi:MAG: biosynthetic arginine decarboxylase [Deltaproteobacteria bacterium]|nr:biosynthetic arginine decarboxylase [Deltaproteobacteria bacterium]